jgi:L-lactate dehydrogenase (cytochrome)
MAGKWFETVAVAQQRAKRRLPKSVYGALVAGAEKGLTARDNVEAFSELGFAPHVAGLPASRAMATTVMGQPVSMPVLISPTGVQAVHPDGEVAVARAAATSGRRDGAVLLRQQALGGGRRGLPADVLPAVLGRLAR